MAIARGQVVLYHDSGLPEDVTVNTWHFLIPGSIGDWVNAAPALEDFYNAIPATQSSTVGSHLASTFTGQGDIKWYDLADPEPRVPLDVTPFTFTPGTTTLPAEVALCCSFQADQLSGAPQARRRGRVFLGPLDVNGNVNSTGRPHATLMAVVAESLRDFIAASMASSFWSLAVYSPTDNAAREVTNGWVDNAFDTQRRRGLQPTVRTLVTDTTPA